MIFTKKRTSQNSSTLTHRTCL